MDVGPIYAGHGRGRGGGAHGHCHHVIPLAGEQLRGGLGVQMDLHAQPVHLGDHEVLKLFQRPFEGGVVSVLELSAQLAAGFIQGDVVAPLGGDAGKL